MEMGIIAGMADTNLILSGLSSSYWKKTFAAFDKEIKAIEPDGNITFNEALEKIKKRAEELSDRYYFTLKTDCGSNGTIKSLAFIFPETDNWLNRTFSLYMNEEIDWFKIGKLPDSESFNSSQYKRIIRWIELYVTHYPYRLEKLLECARESCSLNLKFRLMTVKNLSVLVKNMNEKNGTCISWNFEENPFVLKVLYKGITYEVFISFEAVMSHFQGLKDVLMNPEKQKNNAFPVFIAD